MPSLSKIRETLDRACTAMLVHQLFSCTKPDAREEIVETLQLLSDPRCVPPLEKAVLDEGLPVDVRRAAGRVVSGAQRVSFDRPASVVREWWESDDAVLQEYALRLADWYCCGDLIRKIARRPTHPLYSIAIEALSFGFFECQVEKMAALAHPDAEVRAVAAEAILWDEPVIAEEALHRALSDEEAVAVEAANALEYYPTVRTIARLHSACRHASKEVARVAERSLEGIRDSVRSGLLSLEVRGIERVSKWGQPVSGILGEALQPRKEELGSPKGVSSTPKRRAPETVELRRALDDSDCSPQVRAALLVDADWDAIPQRDRGELRVLLKDHDDPEVRALAGRCLATWGDEDSLRCLLDDESFGVRKSALYWLGALPKNRSIAVTAWNRLLSDDARGTHGAEAVEVYATHGPTREVRGRLIGLARDTELDESVRVRAIYLLGCRDGGSGLRGLEKLLGEPPTVSWAVHIALVQMLTGSGMVPNKGVVHLSDIDHFHVQAALGEIEDAEAGI